MVAMVVSSYLHSIMLNPTHYNLKANTHTQPMPIHNARTQIMMEKLAFKAIIVLKNNQSRISKQLLRNNPCPFMSMPGAITFDITVVEY